MQVYQQQQAAHQQEPECGSVQPRDEAASAAALVEVRPQVVEEEGERLEAVMNGLDLHENEEELEGAEGQVTLPLQISSHCRSAGKSATYPPPQGPPHYL